MRAVLGDHGHERALELGAGGRRLRRLVRGLDPVTGQPAATVEERVRLIFDYIAKTLAQHGCSFASVLATRVYVTDMAGARPLVNDAYVAAFGEAWPTRTIVEVAGLNQGDDIEIEVVAARAA